MTKFDRVTLPKESTLSERELELWSFGERLGVPSCIGLRLDYRSMLLGAAAGVVALVAAFGLLMHAGSGGQKEQRHRTLKLASGRKAEVMAVYLGFGDEHSQRGAIDDGVSVEYVTSLTDDRARGDEAAEVFEAIRPLAEALGVGVASVSAFPSATRQGRFVRHEYTRDAAGRWTGSMTTLGR
jgi:hypothetical protein